MDSQHGTDEQETPATEALRDALGGPPATKLHLIQHHGNMALLLAKQLLEEEVEDLAEERYSHKSRGNSLRRWGTNPGSIRPDGEKVPIDVPRVRDTDLGTDLGEERPLESYQAMWQIGIGEDLLKALMLGISR
jgi:hypothetical protein